MTNPQAFLDDIAARDMFNFLQGIETNYETHRPLLLLAMNLLPPYTERVVELGSGEGSTPYLFQMCQQMGKRFYSYEGNEEWAKKTGATYVADWDKDDRWKDECGLLFIDHAPGEHRKVALANMINRADIIVVHDTELVGAGDYRVEPIIQLFKHTLHTNRRGGGAGASMMSQEIDLTQFRGLSLGKHKLE